MSTSIDSTFLPSEELKRIENAISHTTRSLKQLSDEDEILLSIEQDPNLKLLQTSSTASSIQKLDVNELSARDNDIIVQLDLAGKLWILKSLIEQINIDLEMNEYMSIFDSLNKLRVKSKDLEQKNKNSLIVEKVELQITEFEQSLDKTLYQLINEQFWKFQDDSIQLNLIVEANEYSELSYDELIEILSSSFEADQSQFNKKLFNYLNLNSKIDECLVQPLINDKFDLEFNKGETFLKLNKLVKKNDIFSYVNSMISCVKFISLVPSNKNLKNYMIKPILNSLERKLLEENVELLMSDIELKTISLELSTLLSENDWFNKSENDLLNWVNDSINFWIDKKFKDSLSQVRDILIKEISSDETMFQDLSEVQIDSWDWDDDEDELKKDTLSKTETNDDDWDAWDNEDDKDLFKDELDEKQVKESHKISKIPQRCYDEIVLPFLQLSLQIKELNIEGLLVLRLKDLLTDIFIVMSEIYNEKKLSVLFINDFQKLLELTKLQDIYDNLNTQLNNYLELVINEYKFEFIKIWNSSIGEFEELNGDDDEDNNSEIELFLSDFQDYIGNLNAMADLNLIINFKITNLLLISNLTFILEFLIKKILSMPIISEASSIKISNFQKSFLKIFRNMNGIQTDNLKNYNKFEKISMILMANLKKIELSFNDGEFFDFETQELTKLIELLFVESEMRNSLIQYIVDVRSEE